MPELRSPELKQVSASAPAADKPALPKKAKAIQQNRKEKVITRTPQMWFTFLTQREFGSTEKECKAHIPS
jgi:hypothetical protein